MQNERERRVFFLVRLPATLRARLDSFVLMQRVSRNDFVLEAIEEKLIRLERAASQSGEHVGRS